MKKMITINRRLYILPKTEKINVGMYTHRPYKDLSTVHNLYRHSRNQNLHQMEGGVQDKSIIKLIFMRFVHLQEDCGNICSGGGAIIAWLHLYFYAWRLPIYDIGSLEISYNIYLHPTHMNLYSHKHYGQVFESDDL